MIDFDKLLETYEFASMAPEGQAQAYVNKETGETILYSEYADLDPLPDDIDDEKYVELPTKRDLDLGRQLVFDFANEYLPDHVDDIFEMFRNRGAYSRFKDFVADRDLLQKWYAFEKVAQERELRDWCRRQDLPLSSCSLSKQ